MDHCNVYNIVLTPTANASDSITLILAVSVVLTAIVFIIVGAFIGSVVTYFCIKRASKSVIETSSSPHNAMGSVNPVYEEILVTEQKIKMGDNLAYGPSMRWSSIHQT